MNQYQRNPKGVRGGKYGPSEQDEEDCEQEKLIKEWLKQQGANEQFEFKHINSKGTARNTLVRAQVRLDQQVFDDSAGTFADRIAGCDGRDLECGPDALSVEPETPEERLNSSIDLFFEAIGLSEEIKQWATKLLKSRETLKSLTLLMNDDAPW